MKQHLNIKLNIYGVSDGITAWLVLEPVALIASVITTYQPSHSVNISTLVGHISI